MKNDEFPYQKITFILSVIGFIGSIGFYYGVLKNLQKEKSVKSENIALKKEVEHLKKQLKEAKK